MNETKKPSAAETSLITVSPDESFGHYLRRIRSLQNISVRQLAKSLDITPTYLSDIENGNNKPPDKALLLKIIDELNLDDSLKVKNNLFDLAAKGRNDIPADIKEYILNNRDILQIIREAKEQARRGADVKNLILKERGGCNYEK